MLFPGFTKALIEQAEFKRNKVRNPDERFFPCADNVLPLGRDMHLLDLRSTSHWCCKEMTLPMEVLAT